MYKIVLPKQALYWLKYYKLQHHFKSIIRTIPLEKYLKLICLSLARRTVTSELKCGLIVSVSKNCLLTTVFPASSTPASTFYSRSNYPSLELSYSYVVLHSYKHRTSVSNSVIQWGRWNCRTRHCGTGQWDRPWRTGQVLAARTKKKHAQLTTCSTFKRRTTFRNSSVYISGTSSVQGNDIRPHKP